MYVMFSLRNTRRPLVILLRLLATNGQRISKSLPLLTFVDLTKAVMRVLIRITGSFYYKYSIFVFFRFRIGFGLSRFRFQSFSVFSF